MATAGLADHDSDLYPGVGVDSPRNKWVYDTTQFDNILKKLKVVRQVKRLPFSCTDEVPIYNV